MSVREAKVLAISFFLLRMTTLEALQDDRCLSVSGLAGEPIANLNTVVRGIGFLLMIVPILLLAIAGDRWASRDPV